MAGLGAGKETVRRSGRSLGIGQPGGQALSMWRRHSSADPRTTSRVQKARAVVSTVLKSQNGFIDRRRGHISDRLDYLGKQAARRPVNQG